MKWNLLLLLVCLSLSSFGYNKVILDSVPQFPQKNTIDCNDTTIFITEVPAYPLFETCDSFPEWEKRDCAQNQLQAHIKDKLLFPVGGVCIEGTCVIRMTITKTGVATNYEVVRDLGGHTGQEAIRVLKLISKWSPARRCGQAFDCQVMYPVRFKLQH